jgi:hypothetical protein
MAKVKLFLSLCIVFMLMSCAPTVVTKSITETTHPDGSKTTSVTKTLSQSISTPETKSTEEVKRTFDK